MENSKRMCNNGTKEIERGLLPSWPSVFGVERGWRGVTSAAALTDSTAEMVLPTSILSPTSGSWNQDENQSRDTCTEDFGEFSPRRLPVTMCHHEHMPVRYLCLSWNAVHSSISVASAIRKCGRLLAAKDGASGTLLCKHGYNPPKLTST